MTKYNHINNNFEVQYSTFVGDVDSKKLRADVYSVKGGHWGCRFWKDNVWWKDEVYEGHSEDYAEDAAENYVLGIKILT